MKHLLIALILSILIAFLLVNIAHAEKITIKTTYTLRTKYAKEPALKVAARILPTPTPKLTKPKVRVLKAVVPVDKETVAKKIREVFGADAEVAIAIARAESGLRTEAVGDMSLAFNDNGVIKGMSCGIFQIRIIGNRPTCEQLQDLDTNVRYAYGMFKAQGWNPWSVYHSQSYLSYLSE